MNPPSGPAVVVLTGGGAAPHAGAIRPRLDSSSALAGSVAARLGGVLRRVAGANAEALRRGGRGAEGLEGGVGDELLLRQAEASLRSVRSAIAGASSLRAIPRGLAPAASVARALGSALSGPAPACGRGLCGLSVALGGIVADSAALTGSRCDFGLSNAEAGRILGEAREEARREVRRRYPNLPGAAPGIT